MPSFGTLLQTLPAAERKLVRKIEKTYQKCNASRAAILFNEIIIIVIIIIIVKPIIKEEEEKEEEEEEEKKKKGRRK